MNMRVKLTRIGNSTGVILPRAVLTALGAEAGDFVSLSTTETGVELQPCREDFETQMAAAREVMARRKLALRELAK
jgi:putative addiction module antidote